MLILSLIASLLGCNPPEVPQILDGPGMVYVDSEERTDYANAIGYNDEDSFMCAVAFLGYGDEGAQNAASFIDKCFATLTAEQREAIETVLYDGNEWYLIVPRYRGESIWIDYLDENGEVTNEGQRVSSDGTPFILRCNPSDTYSNMQLSGLSRGRHFAFSPQIDKNGKLITEQYVERGQCFLMDITEQLGKLTN